jgi:RND family efflux transporter MFP subunit
MYFKILIIVGIAFSLAACSNNRDAEAHEEHEEVKIQFTSYSNDFELFAEADPFVVNETSNVLSHFSTLPDFKAVESGKITIVLTVNSKEVRQTLDKPTRKGIYSFDIQPETQGKGTLRFEITNEKGSYEVVVPEVMVFASHTEAHETVGNLVHSKTNTSVFTKEQSWKIDFSTNYPETEPFGQVIKTTALVQSLQGDEMIVTAKTNGIVYLSGNNLLEGKEVSTGQLLFSISGSGLSDNNSSVRFAEAKNNYEKANADYERAKELAKDKIVSEKDLIAAKNQYDNAKVIYDNLNKNFNASGQSVTSPMNGFVKQVHVKNGAYVVAGQPILTVSQNKTLVLSADLPQKYVSVLGSIYSANIRTLQDNLTYTFEQLNGKVLSYGKAANSDNYLIPVNLQIDNKGGFTAGSFVEIYLKTLTNSSAITIPNTSLLEEQGNYFVWVQITPELFEKREVSIGNTDGLKTEVLKGITSNERIVTRGAMLIKLAQATGTLDAHSGHVH